jgi:AraC-like DNA-binding protein
MSKNDVIQTEHNFGKRSEQMEGFRIYQTGCLSNMRQWQYKGLSGSFWRFYHHIRSGSAIRLNQRLIPLKPGEILLIPENTRFDGRGVANTAQFWIHFLPPLQVISAPRVLRISIGASLSSLLREWRTLIPRARTESSNRRLFHICQAILHASFAHTPLPDPPATSPDLQKLLEEIERSLAEPPDNRTMARQMGRNVEGFIRWFRAETGTTPARYVTGRRIREASRLLTLTDRSIEEIAESVGFANRHHFTRVFKNHVGQPPVHFRGEQREIG